MSTRDEEIVERLRTAQRRIMDPRSVEPNCDCDVRVLEAGGGRVRVQFLQGTLEGSVDVALPSSNAIAPWLYMVPKDSNDWVGQLLIWFDEEMFTGGLGPSRARINVDGHDLLVVAPYGLRRSDPSDHSWLLGLASPEGWSGLRANDFGPHENF
ncbi:hypothetical protein ACVXZ4_14295 [Lacisediminihabitans sp. FW035]